MQEVLNDNRKMNYNPVIDFNSVRVEDLADHGVTLDNLVETLEQIQKANTRVSTLEKDYPTASADFYDHTKNSQKKDYLQGLQFQ